MQFVRYQRSTGAMNVWSYDPSQTNPDDASRAGIVTLPPLAKPPLPRPRVGVYGLGEVAAASAGGSTSRMGADFSIPVTQTASVFGTLHPDYSNVELDQQSISPTVFARTYAEVRPFFTQAASFYGFNCDVCNGFRTLLYTPGIPTPSQGYAFEGKQGNFGFTGFDAIGDQRNDSAAALTYTTDDTHWNGVFNHVTADIPGIVDDANGGSLSWFSGKYLSAYVDYSQELGTLVTDPTQGQWIDGGGGWSNQHFALYGSMREVGSQFNPVDGFDSHPGIAGYALFGARDWTFAPQSFLASAGISGFLDRYQGVQYGEAQSDNAILVDFLTKSTWDLQLSSGSDYWRFGTELTPISQNAGFTFTYHSGMQNNMNNFPAHGASATPTSISYTTGAYGDGRLDTWFRTTTMRAGNRGSLTLALDNTAQWLNGKAPDNIQWFDEPRLLVPTRSGYVVRDRPAARHRRASAAQRRRQLHGDVLERLDRVPQAVQARRALRCVRQPEHANHGSAGDLQADLLHRSERNVVAVFPRLVEKLDRAAGGAQHDPSRRPCRSTRRGRGGRRHGGAPRLTGRGRISACHRRRPSPQTLLRRGARGDRARARRAPRRPAIAGH